MKLKAIVSSSSPFKSDSYLLVFVCFFFVCSKTFRDFKTRRNRESFKPISKWFHIFIRNFWDLFRPDTPNNPIQNHSKYFCNSFLLFAQKRRQYYICFLFSFVCVLASCPQNVRQNYIKLDVYENRNKTRFTSIIAFIFCAFDSSSMCKKCRAICKQPNITNKIFNNSNGKKCARPQSN